MITITKEFTKEQLQQIIETDHVQCGEASSLARTALASLEAEAVGEVVLGEYDDCGCHPDARVACIAADGQADWENFKDGTRLYTAPPAPVAVPAAMEMDDDFDSAFEHGKAVGWNAYRAAMLQGGEPVTTKDDGGRYEQDDSPECGWVVTHSGKDYFYREQKDAVMHMNSAVESGRSVSLRSLIPEPVSEPYKLNDPVIPESSTCKYCGGTGYFRWQQSENMCPCPCVGCDLPAAPQQEVKP
ncbi:TPA: hypothetical protein ACH1O8_003969 [Enterobacter roggenkampii]